MKYFKILNSIPANITILGIILTLGILYNNSLITSKAETNNKTFYIDQTFGNDSNSGILNSPFKSIERAQDEIKKINSTMVSDLSISISGQYQVKSPIAIDTNSSGKNGFKVKYISNPSNPGFIHGANTYKNGWLDNGNGIYRINLGKMTQSPREIYINGSLKTRSTSEGDGYSITQSGGHQLRFTDGKTISNWGNLNDVEFEGVAKNYWKHTIEKVANTNGSQVNLINAGGLTNGDSDFKSGHLVNIRNAFELITRDGEWYYNKANNNLYLKSSSNPNGSELSVPTSEGLFNIQGANDLEFEGLTFAYSAWNAIPNKIGIQTMGQGGVVNKSKSIGSFEQDIMDGAINMNYTQNINFTNNRFQNLSSYALACKDGCKNQKINTNEFLNMGAGAVIYGNISGHNVSTEISNINIQNNLIKNTGVNYYGAAALSIIYGKNVLIDHNELNDISYSPIAVGWGWNKNSDQLKDNKITSNRISNFMTKVFDGAGVYTLSNQPGTIISNNYIYDAKHDYGGIYPDEGSSKIKIDSNVLDVGPNFWLYIWSDDKMVDLSVTNNFIKSYGCNTNFGTYSTRNDLCEIKRGQNTTYGNNISVSDQWPANAQTIINNSGRLAKTIIEPPVKDNNIYPSFPVTPIINPNVGLPKGIKKLKDIESIKIDGLTEDLWTKAEYTPLNKDLGKNISSSRDLSSKYKSLWNADAIYILIDINDDILNSPSNIPSYQRDGVEILIDNDNSKNTNYDGKNDCKFIFNYSKSIGRVLGANDVFSNGQNNCTGNNVVYSVGLKEGGYSLEIKIPWLSLGSKLKTHSQNDLIGFDMFVDDNDGGNVKESVLAYNASTPSIYINPSLWDSVKLIP